MLFLTLIYLAFISLGLPDSLLGSAWPIMHADLGVPMGNAGFISVTVSCGTIISSLFSHRLIRRFGTGKITVISVSLTAAALLGSALIPSFWGLIICAIPLGIGAGAIDSGLNEFVAEHYEARHMNWLHCMWGVGTMLGPVLISALTHAGRSWRNGYFSISMAQFVLAFLLMFSLPMWKRFQTADTPHEVSEKKQTAEKTSIFAPLRAKGAGFAMLIFFMYTSAESCMMLWGASYLVSEKGLSAESAAGWVSFFFVGITVGRGVSGFLSMRLSNEKMIKLGTLLLLAGVGILFLPLPPAVTVGAYVLIGLGMAPVFPAMLHQTPVYFRGENAQAAMGLQMACAYTGTTFMPPLLGQIFSLVSFRLMPVILLLLALGLLLAALRLSAVAKKTSV